MTLNLALTIAVPAASAQQAPAGQGAQNAPANADQGTQAAPAAGQFGRMLVARVADASGAKGQHVQGQAIAPVAWNLPGGEWANLLSGSDGESLPDKLDALLRLTESGEWTLSEEQHAEVDAALEDLRALMMALFGIALPMPETDVPVPNPTADRQTDIAAEEAPSYAADRTAARSGLIETIAFVRSFLAEGAFRPLAGQEKALFESLIVRLQRALAPADETAPRMAESGLESAAPAETSAAAVRPSTESTLDRPVREAMRRATTVVTDTQRPEGARSAEALLARLARQPMQASVAAVVTETRLLEGVPNAENMNTAQAANGPVASTLPSVQGAQPHMTVPAEEAQVAASDSVEPMPVVQAVQSTQAHAAPETARTEAPVRQPVPTVPVERFHDVISGMAVRQLRLSAASGVSEARILLVPEHLGEVAVRITLQNGQLTAQFVTENSAAKELIENQLVMLRGVLQSQGIQVERLEVTQGTAAAQSQLFQDQRQRGGQERHEGGRGKRGDDSLSVFESELIEQVAIRELGYGRAINMKA